MKLYHFTARRFAGPIRRDGLHRGHVAVSLEPVYLLGNYQWLTRRKSWQQEWAEGSGNLPYRTDEVRLTVDIPKGHEAKVLPRDRWEGLMTEETARVLTAFGDPDNWVVFHGVIPPTWIVKAESNPRLIRT